MIQVITYRVREVTQNIAEVEAGHSDLRDGHLQEGRKSGEDAEFVLVETEACSSAEVAALHDCKVRYIPCKSSIPETTTYFQKVRRLQDASGEWL